MQKSLVVRVLKCVNKARFFAALLLLTSCYSFVAHAAPTGLTATKGSQANGIALQWQDTASSTYRIYRALGVNGIMTEIATVTTKTYQDTAADKGVTYGYRIRNAAGTWSNIDYGYQKLPAQSLGPTVANGYTKVSAGNHHSLALKADGRLFASGLNANGQLGDGTVSQSTVFKPVLTGVSDMLAGASVSFALKTNGTLWATGSGYSNTWQQILTGVSSLHTNYNKSTFWAVVSGVAYTGTQATNWAPTLYTNIKQITSVLSGTTPVIVTLRNDGSLFEGSTQRSTGIKKIQTVVYGNCGSSCVNSYVILSLRYDNSLWAFRGNANLPDGSGRFTTTAFRKVLDNVKDVSATEGALSVNNVVLATLNDGSLWSAGRGTSTGQNGDGSTFTPYWKQVFDQVSFTSIGIYHSLALRTNGTIWVTGDNPTGLHGLSHTDGTQFWTRTGLITPNKVQNLNATDGTEYGRILITWTPSPDATKYDLYRSFRSGDKGSLLASNLTSASFVHNTGLSSTPQFYTVVAKNDEQPGNILFSPDSDQDVGFGKIVPVMTDVTASQGTSTGNIRLQWPSHPDATGYEIWRASSPTAPPTKIATLTSVPVSSYQDSTVQGVASYFYTLKVIVGSLIGPQSNLAEGWANAPPTAAVLTLSAGSTVASELTLPTITDPNVTAGKSEAFTYSITEQPTAGTLSINSGSFLYTPPADGKFSGTLSFKFRVTDKGGATLVSNGTINVLCANPTISSLSLPVSSVLQAAPFYADATYSFPECSTHSRVKLDVLDGNSVEVVSGINQSTPKGINQVRPFLSHGIASLGTYIVRLTAASDSGSTSKTALLTVNAINLPNLTVSPSQQVIINETPVQAKLTHPTQINCPFTTDLAAAMTDPSKCHLTLHSSAPGLVRDNSGDLPALSGIISGAGNYDIIAEVFKHDGTAMVKVGQVIRNTVVSCAAPVINTLDIPKLLPNEIPRYSAVYKAYSCNGPLTGSLVIKKGFQTVETLPLSSLAHGDNATLTRSGTGLTVGDYTAELSITGAAGTQLKTQAFSVEDVTLPTLNVSHEVIPQGEVHLQASLQPLRNPNCSLTSVQSEAENDTKKCYVTLTTNIQAMQANFDASGLPTLSGYPYVVGEYTLQARVSRWASGVRYDDKPITKTIRVTAVIQSQFEFTGKNNVFIGIEKLNLTLKQLSGPLCVLFDNEQTAEIEASRGKRACFVTTTGTDSLTKKLSLNQYKLEGSLNKIGRTTLGLSIKRYFPNGSSMILQNSHFDVTVNELPPPELTFRGGQKIIANKYYVPLNQAVTRAIVSAGVTTAAKMKISIQDSAQNFERENVSNGAGYWVTTPELKLLEERNLRLRVAWQDYPQLFKEYLITAVGGTESNMRLSIDTPTKTPDTEMISVRVKVGKLLKNGVKYTPETMGNWRVKILAETNNDPDRQAVTESVDLVEGVATFRINPSGHHFMKLTAAAELVSSVDGLESTLLSPTRYVQVVKGSPIQGTVVANTREAPWPKAFRLKLNMTLDNRAALQSATWYESDDEGSTWINYNPANTFAYSLAMDSPGKKLIRVKMVNKNTLLESYSDPVELFSYAKVVAKIIGPRHAHPNQPVTFSAEHLNNGSAIRDTVDQWTIDSSTGRERFTGKTITFTPQSEGKVSLTLRSRPSNTSETDPNSWTTIRSHLGITAPSSPTINAQGPRNVETGKTYRYTGTARPSWGSIQSVNNLITEWQLPDGKTVSGRTLDWRPTTQDLIDTKPLIFRAWVSGYKETTSKETTIKYVPWQYVWPNFTVSVKQFTPQAPSDLALQVTHDAPKMNTRFEGLSYHWSYPESVNGRSNEASPSRAMVQVLQAGQYTVSITIKDKRGHQTVLNQQVSAEEPVPYRAQLRLAKSNLADRAPMSITVRPTVSGGHPLDSVIAQSWSVDGAVIDEYQNRPFMITTIAEPGNHTISYTLHSKMGKTMTSNAHIHLTKNQLPTCELISKPNSFVVYVESKCTDPDGKIIGYSWRVNDQPIGSTSYRISFSKSGQPQSAKVTIIAMDDAKELSVPVSIHVNY